ncbi:MAG: hypothetical protein ACI83D_000114 [Planctomycetota bacterium]|jgi:uncharacterized protein (TIGR02453 family)
MLNPQKTFSFLKQITENNNRAWFADHKSEYKELHGQFTEFMHDIASKISTFDPGLRKSDTKDATKVFRIYRDARFSRDNKPYKLNLGGQIIPGGRTSPLPSYYLHIQPGGKSFVGGGLYHPEAKDLSVTREYIAENYKKLDKLTTDKKFQSAFPELWQGEALKTVPRGYKKDHPAAKYLRLKNYIWSIALSDKQVLEKDLQAHILEKFELLLPVFKYLRKAISTRDQ